MNINKEKHLERKPPVVELIKQLQSLWYGIRVHTPIIALYGFADLTSRWMYGVPPRRFSTVHPGLHIGGQFSKQGWPRLKRRGNTAVVNMRREYDDEALGIAPLHYLHLNVIDNTPPTLNQLQTGVDFIRKEIADGGQVYIHCAAGIGRAPTMAAAYLVSTGLSPREAWHAIRRVRPFIRPTLGQVQQIEAFAAQQTATAKQELIEMNTAAEGERKSESVDDKRKQ